MPDASSILIAIPLLLLAALAGWLVYQFGWVRRPRRARASGFEYVYINQDGSVRELSSFEKAYLLANANATGGDRAYIKSCYEAVDGDGSLSGFLPRRQVPSGLPIQPVDGGGDFYLTVNDEQCPLQNGSLLIWLDAHVAHSCPQLLFRLTGAPTTCRLNQKDVTIEPQVHLTAPVTTRDWRLLAGMKFTQDTPGAQLVAYGDNSQMADGEDFSITLPSLTGHHFTVECQADVTLHDFEPDPILTRFRARVCLPFDGVSVGIPSTVTDPAQEAIACLSRFLDPTLFLPPVILGRKPSPEGPVVAFEANFRPLPR